MNFPTHVSRMSPFPILGVLSVIFHFYSNFNRTFCEQTVQTLIRSSDLDLHCLSMSHTKEVRLKWVVSAQKNCLIEHPLHKFGLRNKR